jgi:hypothetical protein
MVKEYHGKHAMSLRVYPTTPQIKLKGTQQTQWQGSVQI